VLSFTNLFLKYEVEALRSVKQLILASLKSLSSCLTGALYVASTRTNAFSERDLLILNLLATQAGIIISSECCHVLTGFDVVNCACRWIPVCVASKINSSKPSCYLGAKDCIGSSEEEPRGSAAGTAGTGLYQQQSLML
jgi:hypothetical protein